MSRENIDRIMFQPFSSLSRHEMNVKKLLSKFHDNPDIIKRELNNRAFGFDPNLAERVRVKQFKLMSFDEKSWCTLDKILHPEVCSLYIYIHVCLREREREKKKSLFL